MELLKDTRVEEWKNAGFDSCAQFPESDLGNARRLIELFGEDVRYVPGKGWFIWNGVKWVNDKRAAIRKAKDIVEHIPIEISALANDTKKKSRLTHHIKSGQAQRLIAMLKVPNTFYAYISKFNIRGTYNVK